MVARTRQVDASLADLSPDDLLTLAGRMVSVIRQRRAEGAALSGLSSAVDTLHRISYELRAQAAVVPVDFRGAHGSGAAR